ncbi:hypothetical protein EBZ37_14200, partial [bacterium]|nr:hypothetical protein [bacterium]
KSVRISEAELEGETGRVSEGKLKGKQVVSKSKRKHKSDLEANSSDEPSEPPPLNAAEDDDDVPDHPPPPANEGENEMDLDNDTIPAPSDVEAGTVGVGERRGMAVRRQRKAILLAPLGQTKTKTKAGIESSSSMSGGGSLHSPSERVKSARNIKEKVKNTLAALGASRFEKWTSDELILTLIQGGIEVRNESVVDHGTLVGLVESLYDGKEMPEKVAPYSQHELEKIEWVVRKIQNLFIERSANRRAEDERHTLFERPDPSDISASYTELNLNDALEDDDEPYDYEDGGDGEKHWFANPIKVNKAGRTYERKRVDNPKRGEDEHTGRETEFEFRASEFDGSLLVSGARERRAPKSRSVKILDIPWHAPSWTKAEEHMNY